MNHDKNGVDEILQDGHITCCGGDYCTYKPSESTEDLKNMKLSLLKLIEEALPKPKDGPIGTAYGAIPGGMEIYNSCLSQVRDGIRRLFNQE